MFTWEKLIISLFKLKCRLLGHNIYSSDLDKRNYTHFIHCKCCQELLLFKDGSYHLYVMGNSKPNYIDRGHRVKLTIIDKDSK